MQHHLTLRDELPLSPHQIALAHIAERRDAGIGGVGDRDDRGHRIPSVGDNGLMAQIPHARATVVGLAARFNERDNDVRRG